MGTVNNVNPVTNFYSTYIPDYAATRVGANTTEAAAAAYAQVVALQAEEEVLNQDDSTSYANDNSAAVNDVSLGSSDLLNLSPAALNILNGVDDTNTGNTTSLTLTGTVSGNGTTDTTTLTAAQQTQAAAIAAQFANQPLTQTTFTQIDNALTAAGINPAQFSIQQLFNAYAYAYEPGFAFNGQVFTDTLASELDNA